MSERTVPAVVDSDGDDTRWALETANTLFEQGEAREALRWVRRAAEAAAEAGQDTRALELAKSVSELRERVDIPRTLPPPPAREAGLDGFAAPAMAPLPSDLAPLAATTSAASGPAVPAAASSPDRAQKSDAQSTGARSENELLVTVVSADGSMPARNASFVGHRAVRVAIFPASASGEGFLVRPLAAGEVAPEESTVGLLVSFDATTSPLPRES